MDYKLVRQFQSRNLEEVMKMISTIIKYYLNSSRESEQGSLEFLVKSPMLISVQRQLRKTLRISSALQAFFSKFEIS